MEGIMPARVIETSCQINENLHSSSSTDTRSPTCLLQMTIEEPTSLENEKPKRKDLTVDLTSSMLNTLLEDFIRIREQLANIARK